MCKLVFARDSEINFGKKLKSLGKIPRHNSVNLTKDSESRSDASIYREPYDRRYPFF